MDIETAVTVGSLVAGASGGLWGYLKSRAGRKDSLDDAVRKELWDEIAALRADVRAANSLLVEWQGKYLTLMALHSDTTQALEQCRTYSQRMSNILNNACISLEKIEAIERKIDGGAGVDVIRAEIKLLSAEAAAIRTRAASAVVN